MIRKSEVLFYFGGLLLILLASVVYAEAEFISELARKRIIVGIVGISTILLLGVIIGYHFARQNYFGRVLQLDQLEEGEYDCNKNTGCLITADKSNPRFIHVRQYYSSIERIPLGMDFTLTVSTETGRETFLDYKELRKFTRRLFKANWKNAGKNEEARWSMEV